MDGGGPNNSLPTGRASTPVRIAFLILVVPVPILCCVELTSRNQRVLELRRQRAALYESTAKSMFERTKGHVLAPNRKGDETDTPDAKFDDLFNHFSRETRRLELSKRFLKQTILDGTPVAELWKFHKEFARLDETRSKENYDRLMRLQEVFDRFGIDPQCDMQLVKIVDRFSSLDLLSASILASALLGAISRAFHCPATGAASRDIMLGTSAGITVWLVTYGGKALLFRELDNTDVSVDPFVASLFGFLGGIYSERALMVLEPLAAKFGLWRRSGSKPER